MFGAVNILLIFLFIRITSSQQFPDSEYAKFARSPPISNLLALRTEEAEDRKIPLPLLDLQGGDNVQKLVPKHNKYFDKEARAPDDERHLELYGHAYSKKSKKNKQEWRNKGAAPQNVNRIQEMTGQLWPMGIVPYFIDKDIYDPTTDKRIVKAMSAIESTSCVIFRELEKKPKNSPEAWLYFTNPKHERECVHVFSAVDGGTEVVLGFDCLHPDEILHSLLHALGFRDEVTHPHRDHYIRVLWNNIQPKYSGLFRIRHEDASHKLVEYDPMSIMHFHDRAFTDNGEATITALIPGLQIASTTTLSQLDIMRLKLAFSHECNKRNIGDLLVTCKKSLIPQNIKHGMSKGAPDNGNNKSEADLKIDKEIKPENGQDVNDKEQNVDKVEASQGENENDQLEGGLKEDTQEEIENKSKDIEVEEENAEKLEALQEEIETEQVTDEEEEQGLYRADLENENNAQTTRAGNEEALKEAADGDHERIPNKFRSLGQYKSRG